MPNLDGGEVDFYSVAVHEIAHVLGVGTSDAWSNNVTGGQFTGENAVAVNGGNITLVGDDAHWAEGVSSFVAGTNAPQETSFDPTITDGTRKEC